MLWRVGRGGCWRQAVLPNQPERLGSSDDSMCVAGKRQEGAKSEPGLDFSARLALLSDRAPHCHVSRLVGFTYLTARAYKTGQQRSQEKDGSGSGKALEFLSWSSLGPKWEMAALGNVLVFPLACTAPPVWSMVQTTLSPSPTLSLKASPDLWRILCSLRSETLTNGVSLIDKWESGWMPEMTLNGTQLWCLLSLCCFVGGVQGVLRVILHLQNWEAKLQLVLVVDAARVPGETWQEERGIIWEPASLGWVTHEGTAQGWLHWSAKGSRKQKSWEGNWAAHSGRGSGAAWPPRSSKFMLVGPRSHEGRWEGRGAAGLLATVCAPPSRDLQTSESKQVSTPPGRPAKTVNPENSIPLQLVRDGK